MGGQGLLQCSDKLVWWVFLLSFVPALLDVQSLDNSMGLLNSYGVATTPLSAFS